MMKSIIAANVSTLAFLVVIRSFSVSITQSDAFVPPLSIAKDTICPIEFEYNGLTNTNAKNCRSSRLFSSVVANDGGGGISVIDSWTLLPDGRIKGVMAGSGDSVLTSPLKNRKGLKEKATIRTVSGSRYKLGEPASVGAGNNLSANRLGIPRATSGGINVNNDNVRATQPLSNKSRATMPLLSKSGLGSIKNVNLLTPLVGGASAIAIGAAIGTGAVSEKGVDLSKIKNLPYAGDVLKSANSLHLPDIESLRAPEIPKFEGLPSVSAPKLPLKIPDVPTFNVPVPAGIKNLGNTAGDAIGKTLESAGVKIPTNPLAEKKAKVSSVGQDPYRVPMPYLDQKIVQAEKELKAQEEADRILAKEREDAARMQRMREEVELQARKKIEAEFLARERMDREQEAQRTAQLEDRLRREADERVQRVELEAARLRTQVEQEKVAAKDSARLREEAEAALLKEKAAVEEFTQKIQEAEPTKIDDVQDVTKNFADTGAAAASETILGKEPIKKPMPAEDAASGQSFATPNIRKASIGATAARKASYSSPSLSTYQAWQERQRMEYQTRLVSVASSKGNEGVVPVPYSPSSGDNLSTYKKWQQNVAAKQMVSMSNGPVTAAYITGAPAPVANKLVSGTTILSEAGAALNGDLGYVVAGSAALIGGIVYANEYQKIQDELSEFEDMTSPASKSAAPPSTPTAKEQPLPPNVPPSYPLQTKQVNSSATMTIDAKPNPNNSGIEISSVTKEVLPPPPANPLSAPSSRTAQSTTPAMETTKVSNRLLSAPPTPEMESTGRPYLESMQKSSADCVSLKSSYSPFSNPKISGSNAFLYNPPSKIPHEPEKIGPSTSGELNVLDTSESSTSGSEDGRKVSYSSASYLESMQRSSDVDSSVKSSYSPFANPKMLNNDDSLYNPPSTESPKPEEDPCILNTSEKVEFEVDTISGSGDGDLGGSESLPEALSTEISSYNSPCAPQVGDTYDENQNVVNGGSYFDSMPNLGGSGDANLKESYSPFGTPKVMTDDLLYAAPKMSHDLEDDDIYEAPQDENTHLETPSLEVVPDSSISPTNGASYLECISRSDSSMNDAPKTSYSPFSTMKAMPSGGGDSLYDPPGTVNGGSSGRESLISVSSESTTSNQDSYLDALNNSSGSSLKKSYAPFGTKPRAVVSNGYSPVSFD